ncbi:MAG: hypothetical protein RIE58_06100 [Vicingaceae bacterium]
MSGFDLGLSYIFSKMGLQDGGDIVININSIITTLTILLLFLGDTYGQSVGIEKISSVRGGQVKIYKETLIDSTLNLNYLVLDSNSNSYIKKFGIKDNMLHGVYIEWDNGMILFKVNYKHGKLHGKYVTYLNGNVNLTAKYKHNKLHGKKTIYYNNGKVAEKLFYNKGIISDSKFFNENGKKIDLEEYKCKRD